MVSVTPSRFTARGGGGGIFSAMLVEGVLGPKVGLVAQVTGGLSQYEGFCERVLQL